mmetsp:Transcript_16075/g.29464  ORF Transcript_16075/g.29464 Transcript_16075/m.29464 type:complete len:182 (-) Transcript_16075:126-671(-)
MLCRGEHRNDLRIMALNDDMLRLIENDQVAQVAELLDNGFPLNQPLNVLLMCPLHFAASHGSYNVADALLQRGADPNIVDSNGRRPLHYGSANGHLGLIHLLLNYGADPNAISNGGDTPLIKASSFGQDQAVQLLVSRGADPLQRNYLSQTAEDLARMSGRRNIVIFLQGVLERGRVTDEG